MPRKHQLPKILESQVVASSTLFEIDSRLVQFSNGAKRRLERIKGRLGSTVLIVPLLDREMLILIREYCAGTHTYELTFPTGTIGRDEAIEEAADRELKEEVGFGAKRISWIKKLSVLPGHFEHETYIVLAEQLVPERALGDEPEEPTTVRWPVVDICALLQGGEFTEARSVAALLLVERLLKFRAAEDI
ncbi:ADP compounds hydrolase NudE [Bradyrhizobium septentrionale]|uniref:ADP compounds hydrolase NudE n=1 Tax=Bradyrhizobium septentrionale TaxID=1404411 RepID=UPI0015965989|nr:ADP compounds hydrolase NudE [Bradyrhizobium septentrionale]UGY26660.1 ADP compounds hydrolase NudE [Bradyrhizobium septentrionale]